MKVKSAPKHLSMVLRPNAEGNPVIQFLDADGKVTNEFTGNK
jgi:hypothetical protein